MSEQGKYTEAYRRGRFSVVKIFGDLYWKVCEDNPQDSSNPFILDEFALSQSAITAVKRLHKESIERTEKKEPSTDRS